MCDCNSEWVKNAKNELKNLSPNSYEYKVLKYLLDNNHCGENNTVSQKKIANAVGINERELQNILNNFKTKKIVNVFVYAMHRGGGVFIPCDEDESLKVYKEVLSRVYSELNHVKPNINDNNIKMRLEKIMDLINNEINNL